LRGSLFWLGVADVAPAFGQELRRGWRRGHRGRPAGVGVACGLRRAGVRGDDILLIERGGLVGGVPAKYDHLRPSVIGSEVFWAG
jgi:hypothetical protein